MDKRKHSIVYLRDIEQLNSKMKVQLANHPEVKSVKRGEDELFHIHDIEDETFLFKIYNPVLNNEHKIVYPVKYFPKNEQALKTASPQLNSTQVIGHLTNWLGLIKAYNQIQLSEDEVLINQYEEEFYDEFELLDDDANVKAFNPQQQEVIYNWLLAFEQDILNKAGDDVSKPLLIEVNNLRDDIQNLTKQQFVKRLSTLMAHIKKMGLKLLFDVFDVAKKEVIKTVLKSGVQGLGTLTEQLFN